MGGTHAEFAIVSGSRRRSSSRLGTRPTRRTDNSKAYVPPVMREAGTAPTAIFTLPLPPKILDGPPPVLRHAAPEYPAEFVQDSSPTWKAVSINGGSPTPPRLLGASA